MKTIESPDSDHLLVAEAWAELADFDEALNELAKIRPEFRKHPDVITVCWEIAANARQLSQALSLAMGMARLAPEESKGLTCEGSSPTRPHRPLEAYSLLLKALQRYPEDEITAYDLGCICCVLGRPEEALRWIRRAVELGGYEVECWAMEDAELQAMWKDLHGSRRSQHAASRLDHVF